MHFPLSALAGLPRSRVASKKPRKTSPEGGRAVSGDRVALGSRSCFLGYVITGMFSKIHLDITHHHHHYRGALYRKDVQSLEEYQKTSICVQYITPTPLGRFCKHDCSTTKRVPIPNNTSLENLSRRYVSNAGLLLAPALFQLWRYRAWKISPGGWGGDVHRPIRVRVPHETDCRQHDST